MLTIEDHRRDSAGLRYVYPVVSRRAGGVSVGINLNVNSACNWACVYCQVEGLVRGGPPPVDIDCLERELGGFLDAALNGDFMAREVAVEARRLVDVAFSGNGEPTAATGFAECVRRVGKVMARFGLAGGLPLRLITNGSLMHRSDVQEGVRELGRLGGEVWFKIDRALAAEAEAVNGVPFDAARTVRHLEIAAGLAPTWVQTCWFAIDGSEPGTESRAAYCALLKPMASRLDGIHLYGLARPSQQAAAMRLGRLPAAALENFAREIEKETGIRVMVAP
ncbi:MAG: radical SAM protein [Betaproteobacteria bacterium]|nr:radical SAM protein [Betaproteobacteria bacterium]